MTLTHESKHTMTTPAGPVRLERAGEHGEVAAFIFDRPEKSNAYDDAMIACFTTLLAQALGDSSIRAAVITGAGGRVFCAGADKSSLIGRSYEEGLALKSREVFNTWASAPWPTVAAIEGPAVAGGLELALACDLRICNKAAWFALPELDLALIPASGGIWRLANTVGPARARSIILFGKKIDSATALDWGLVTQISEQVLQDAIATAINAAQRDSIAIRIAKLNFEAQSSNSGSMVTEAVSQALLYHRKIL